MRCKHVEKREGPRVPAVHGSFATEVCCKCGMWRLDQRISGHPSNRVWRRKKELSRALLSERH